MALDFNPKAKTFEPDEFARPPNAEGKEGKALPLRIDLMGGIRISRNDRPVAEIGPIKNRALLALLALNWDNRLTREQICDRLWPGSDPSAARNRLSTALVGVRKSLATDEERESSALMADRVHVWIEKEACSCDVAEFEQAFLGLSALKDDDARLQAARRCFELYGGIVAPELYDDWILDAQVRLSEQFDQVTSLFRKMLSQRGLDLEVAQVQARYNRLADSPDHLVAPSPAAPLSASEAWSDSGPIPVTSPLYVVRDIDDGVITALIQKEGVVLVNGPRQSGKTSLLARCLHSDVKTDLIAFTDFQKFARSTLESEETFYLALAHLIAKQAKFIYDFDLLWQPAYGLLVNFDNFLCDLIEQLDGHFYWYLDSADRLFRFEYSNDFFALLRAWYNLRVVEPDSPWSRVTVVIGFARQAHLFIKDVNQSPFNIGKLFFARDFTLAEAQSLNKAMGRPLRDSRDIASLTEALGGRPFLVKRALALIAKGMSLQDFLDRAGSPTGPFADHLERLGRAVRENVEIRETLAAMSRRSRGETSRAAGFLLAEGVARYGTSDLLQFTSRIYESYFKHLGIVR